MKNFSLQNFAILFLLFANTLVLGQIYTATYSTSSYDTLDQGQYFELNENEISTRFRSHYLDLNFYMGGVKIDSVAPLANGVLMFNANWNGQQVDTIGGVAGLSFNASPKLSFYESYSYEVVGTSGNRIFKAQWKNAKLEENTNTYYNEQVWLYEGLDEIEVRVGSIFLDNQGDLMYDELVQVAAGYGLDYTTFMIDYSLFLTGAPTAPNEHVITNMLAPIATETMDTIPDSGAVYKFTPETVTSVEDLTPVGDELYIFPNPVQDQLTVRSLALTSDEVVLSDVTGKEIATKSIENHKIDLEDLVPGIYVLQAEVNGEIHYERIIKE